MLEFVQANAGPLLVLGFILAVVAVGLLGRTNGSHAASCHAFSSERNVSNGSIATPPGPQSKGDGSTSPSVVGGARQPPNDDAASSLPELVKPDQGETDAEDSMGAIRRTTLPIYGLGCGGGGALTIERALTRTPGVRRVYVNPMTEMAYLEYNPAQVTPSKIVAVIEDLGFEAGRPLAV